jgi:PAS domain S-box-containing protein
VSLARGGPLGTVVLEHAPVLVRDPRDRIVLWNQGNQRLYGWSEEEARGRVSHALLATTFPVPLAEIEGLLHRDGRWEGVLRHRHKDGSEIVVSSLWVLDRDASGAPWAIVEVNTDITARIRAEEALRDSEQRFAVMFRRSPLAKFWATFPAGLIEDVSDAWEGLTGMPRAEVVGKGAVELGLLDARVRDRFREELLTRGVAELEAPFATRSGPRTVFVRAETVTFRGATYVLGAMQDVTDRRRAQDALRESEARFRSVFEQAAVGMGRVRFSDARWIDVNDAFCRMLGRSREELLRIPWPEITHPEDVELDALPFRRMAAGELESYTVEKRFLHASGKHVWTKLTLSLVRDGAGRPDYEVAIIEDVGDRKRAEEALRAANASLQEADRRKDEFLGMLSHELRNPLAPIRNALYILDRAQPGGPQARRAREIATRQVAHLTRLVDDLLDVTRIARGKIELRHEPLDLADLARRTADDYRPLMGERGLELALEVPPGPVVVDGDPARLTQVLGNLLSNAAKFTPAGGRVTLALDAEADRAAVHVRDTGPGIAPDVLPTIFEAFTQGKQTLARSEGGLGLGLSLVKGLVALHGGDVAAVSAGPGRGADFVVTLPLARGAARAEVPPGAAPEVTPARRHVLVVDDNRDAAETLAELVGHLGHRVEVAHDAFDALARVVDEVPDVVLCDIGLPGMDGYELARQLRALTERHDVRLVALSGYAQPEDIARALEAGFDAHVAKPPDPERLAGLLV